MLRTLEKAEMNKRAAGTLVAILALGALVAGCAAPRTWEQRLVDRGQQVGEERRDIRRVSVSGFNALDDRHILIDGGVAEDFLLTLRIDCPEALNSEGIGITGVNDRITNLDQIEVRTAGDARRVCPIEQINVLEKRPAQ